MQEGFFLHVGWQTMSQSWNNGAIIWTIRARTTNLLIGANKRCTAGGIHALFLMSSWWLEIDMSKLKLKQQLFFSRHWNHLFFLLRSKQNWLPNIQALTSGLPVARERFLAESTFLILLLTEGSGRESFQPVIFCDGMKNILKQHLLLEEGQSDRPVAKQPLWLLFCYAGPLTRFSVKVASVWFDSSAKLRTRRNQRWEHSLLMWLR